MTSLKSLLRHWRIEHYQHQRSQVDEARFRSHAMLGAYGLTPAGEPSRPRS